MSSRPVERVEHRVCEGGRRRVVATGDEQALVVDFERTIRPLRSGRGPPVGEVGPHKAPSGSAATVQEAKMGEDSLPHADRADYLAV